MKSNAEQVIELSTASFHESAVSRDKSFIANGSNYKHKFAQYHVLIQDNIEVFVSLCHSMQPVYLSIVPSTGLERVH